MSHGREHGAYLRGAHRATARLEFPRPRVPVVCVNGFQLHAAIVNNLGRK